MREQAERLTRLASDLLLLARVDAQPLIPDVEPTDLGDILPALVAQVEPLAATRHQTLSLASCPSAVVLGNADQLIRLFKNLLVNAIHYTPIGGQITIAAHTQRGQMTVQVRDSGPGISFEHLSHVFDRFYRVDRGVAEPRVVVAWGLQ